MFTSAASRAVQICSIGCGESGSSTPIRSDSTSASAGPLQNLAARFGIAQQKPHQGTFGRIGDRQRDDPHVAALEPADDVHQLADAVFQEHGELADRRIVAAAHRGEFRSRSEPTPSPVLIAKSFCQKESRWPMRARLAQRALGNPVTISISGQFATCTPLRSIGERANRLWIN